MESVYRGYDAARAAAERSWDVFDRRLRNEGDAMSKSKPKPAKLARGNAVIGQSGGPTAVINQSLVGVVQALQEFASVKKIYGMRHGVNGLTRGEIVDLTKVKDKKLDMVARSPSAALGSSRDKPDAEYCSKILEQCKANDIRYFFYIGGNDSSDTARIVSELADASGYELHCLHVPKTVDNDLMGNDHTPGFPSAARFVATAFLADSLDNRSLPGVKINVVMGRHAGFLTGASALARELNADPDGGPHLVYLPEVPFEVDRFTSDVQAVYDRLGRCQVAVSEGVQTGAGTPLVQAVYERMGEQGMQLSGLARDAHGNLQLSGTGLLGDALAEFVKRGVRPADGKALRVRADTFGYLQRCWPDASPVDQKEARAAGKHAVKLVTRAVHAGSVTINRAKAKAYKAELGVQELKDVAAKTRHMPAEFIEGTSNVSGAFLDYLRPLVGKMPACGVL
jgi:6-phosphofructokinase